MIDDIKMDQINQMTTGFA